MLNRVIKLNKMFKTNKNIEFRKIRKTPNL